MKYLRLSRRALLRGLGGTALALPWLECMQSAHAASSTPSRFVTVFGGFSHGADRSQEPDLVLPLTDGFDLRPGTQPLASVIDELTMVTGLRIPVAAGGEDVPAAGRGGSGDSFHSHVNPLIAGLRQVGDALNTTVTGPSADQIAGGWLGADTAWDALSLRVQAVPYSNTSTERLTPSFRQGTSRVEPVQPAVDPRQLYDALTTHLESADPAEATRRRALLDGRRSVLDLVDRRMGGVMDRLGAADRQRMEQHYDDLRTLETRLARPIVAESGACAATSRPGEYPVDGDAQYASEVERAAHMVELCRLAIACDQTRSLALMITGFRAELGLQPHWDEPWTLHLAHHDGTTDALQQAVSWHFQVFADLVAALRDTPEAGGSLLDNTALVMLSEGGYSHAPGEERSGFVNAHSTENMAALLAGRAGGLTPMGHVRAPEGRDHPVNVTLTALAAAGVPVDSMGEVSGVVPGLGV